MNIDNNELLDRLTEVSDACKEATSTNDTNLNLIIEEINRLACICIDHLKQK
jgi:hypothetical protein